MKGGRASLESSLAALVDDPLGRALLACADHRAIAQRMALADPYGDRERLVEALAAIGLGADAVGVWLEHRLWCAARDVAGHAPLSYQLVGRAHLDETVGHPTVVIAPMTVATLDAVVAVDHFAEGRPVALFGEDLDESDLPTAASTQFSNGTNASAEIRSLLDRGGMYCTYGDFVYGGRSTLLVPFFGTRRPISAGWIRTACHDRTMLLPAHMIRTGPSEVTVTFGEPTMVEVDGTPDQRTLADLAMVVASMLEEGVRAVGAQWLLLATLTFDAPQMAVRSSSTR